MLPAIEDAAQDMGIRARWRERDQAYLLPDLGCRVLARSAERPELITG